MDFSWTLGGNWSLVHHQKLGEGGSGSVHKVLYMREVANVKLRQDGNVCNIHLLLANRLGLCEEADCGQNTR